MSVIIQTLFDDSADKALALDLAEITRKMAIGTDWTEILIGVVLTVDMQGATSCNITGKGLRIGLCSNNCKSMEAGTPHALAARWTADLNSLTDDNLYISGAPPYPYLMRTQDGSDTGMTLGSVSGMWLPRTEKVGGYRGVHLVRIKKASPDWQVYAWSHHGAAPSRDALADGGLDSALQAGSYSPVADLTGTAILPNRGDLPIDEATYGGLDSVQILWPSASVRLVVHHVKVAKWS